MTCKICEIHLDKIQMVVGETSHWIIRHSEFSKNAPGYLYIEPKRHVEAYNELTHEEFLQLGENIKLATDWIYENFSPLKIYTVTVSEAVPHLHFHIVPRLEALTKGIEFLQLALSSNLPESDLVKSELERVNLIFQKSQTSV